VQFLTGHFGYTNQMQKGELIINFSLGGSLIFWGVAGFFQSPEYSIIRIFITVLNLFVGSLIVLRKPVVKLGSLPSILISLPSLICGGLMFKLAPVPSNWNVYQESVFVLGGMVMLISFLFLGRNFSILPGLRQIVSKGPFLVIRHPAYFGETIMLLACLLAGTSLYSMLTLLIFIPSLVLRINAEEKLLAKDESYLIYQSKVKWKLIPYVW